MANHNLHQSILIGLVLGVLLLLANSSAADLGREIHSTDQEEKSESEIDPNAVLIVGRIRTYFKYTYLIDPVTKVMVPRFPNRERSIFDRCRRCKPPAVITEADWKRYEAAVERKPGLWITGVDVSQCRTWMYQNPNPNPLHL